MDRRLLLVPFEPTWLSHPTLDIHAVYRRPVRDRVTYEPVRDEYGFVQWDLTTGLPIRGHYKWTAKGFEYVTLASRDDVVQAAHYGLSDKGTTPLQRPDLYLNQLHGPWHTASYLLDCEDIKNERIAKILLNVASYGLQGAEEFERQTDAGFKMTPFYEQSKAAAKVAGEPVKKRRGRPKGSVNKPREAVVEEEAVAEGVVSA